MATCDDIAALNDNGTAADFEEAEFVKFFCNDTVFVEPCADACVIEDACIETGAEDLAYTIVIQILVFLLVCGLAGSVDTTAFK